MKDEVFRNEEGERIHKTDVKKHHGNGYFTMDIEKEVKLKDGDMIPNTEMKIHISKRNPWDKLDVEDEDKLVVASWAWDGMSFVGKRIFCTIMFF